MTESDPLSTLTEMVGTLLPRSVMEEMRRQKETGGTWYVEVPPEDDSEAFLTEVKFKPGSTVALFKLGEDPVQVIWGEEIPGGLHFLACVRRKGVLQARIYDREGGFIPLQPVPVPEDFSDMPITELINAPGSRSSGRAVRERVNAAQREYLSSLHAHRGSGEAANHRGGDNHVEQ